MFTGCLLPWFRIQLGAGAFFISENVAGIDTDGETTVVLAVVGAGLLFFGGRMSALAAVGCALLGSIWAFQSVYDVLHPNGKVHDIAVMGYGLPIAISGSGVAALLSYLRYRWWPLTPETAQGASVAGVAALESGDDAHKSDWYETQTSQKDDWH